MDAANCSFAMLSRLEFIDKDGVVQLKGRMACEITSCDEILMTETLGIHKACADFVRNFCFFESSSCSFFFQ